VNIKGLKYLVTGGAGFIGAAIVKRLVAEGAQVRVLDDNSRGAPRRLESVLDRIELVQGDVRDPHAVDAATSGVDAVCHLAFVNGTEFFYTKPDLVLEVGVKGIVNVLDACRSHKVRRFILASSSEVYQTPPTIPTPEDVPLSVPDPLNARYSYGGGKIISELMAINYGRSAFRELFVFRPHNVFGPDMGWEHVVPQFALRMDALTREKPEGPLDFPIQGSGRETRAFVYIDDFVDGFITMLTGEPGIYNIGTDEEVSIARIAELIGRCFSREMTVRPGRLQPGSTARRCPDISKLRRLGYSPRVPLPDALERTVSWYREHADLAPAK
jgi:nucleoside-diphosphate-sugar epimerase